MGTVYRLAINSVILYVLTQFEFTQLCDQDVMLECYQLVKDLTDEMFTNKLAAVANLECDTLRVNRKCLNISKRADCGENIVWYRQRIIERASYCNDTAINQLKCDLDVLKVCFRDITIVPSITILRTGSETTIAFEKAIISACENLTKANACVKNNKYGCPEHDLLPFRWKHNRYWILNSCSGTCGIASVYRCQQNALMIYANNSISSEQAKHSCQLQNRIKICIEMAVNCRVDVTEALNYRVAGYVAACVTSSGNKAGDAADIQTSVANDLRSTPRGLVLPMLVGVLLYLL